MAMTQEQWIEAERIKFKQWFDRQQTGHKLTMVNLTYEPYFAHYMWAGWLAAKQDTKNLCNENYEQGLLKAIEILEEDKDLFVDMYEPDKNAQKIIQSAIRNSIILIIDEIIIQFGDDISEASLLYKSKYISGN